MGGGLLFAASNAQPNFVVAIRPGGRGDVTGTHVACRHDKGAVSVPSPLADGGYLFALRDGGVMTCLDAKSGDVPWQQRPPARGNYFASPVAGDGKVYVVNDDGEPRHLRRAYLCSDGRTPLLRRRRAVRRGV